MVKFLFSFFFFFLYIFLLLLFKNIKILSIAICALASSNNENCYIAYPSPASSQSTLFSSHGSQQVSPSGDVLIFDALQQQLVNIVQAHKSPIAYVSINSEGT